MTAMPSSHTTAGDDSFTVEVTSVPDRNRLVAEIWRNGVMVAEVGNDGPTEAFTLEIYARDSSAPWTFGLEEWMSALNEAKRRLLGAHEI